MKTPREFHALVASTSGLYYATLRTYTSGRDFDRVEASNDFDNPWALVDLFPTFDEAQTAAEYLNTLAGFN